MVNNSTKSLIERHLLTNGSASVAELSKVLNLTKSDIRYNLNNMISDGFVCEKPPGTSVSRGRPAKRFFIDSRRRPDNFPEVLDLFLSLTGPNTELIERIVTEQTATYQTLKKTNRIERLNDLVNFLNQRNYKARWEAHQYGPEIIIRNCPYQQLISNHDFFCKMDMSLIERLSENPCDHITSWLNEKNCIFRLRILR